MDLPDQLQPIFLNENFKNYLRNSTLSEKTVRNYLSDFSHFNGWAHSSLCSSGQAIQANGLKSYFNSNLIEEYKKFMQANRAQIRTINRRLATIRNFGKYLVHSGLLLSNPVQIIKNVQMPIDNKNYQILVEFKKHLEEQKISKKTAVNYLSDTRSFLKFAIEYQRN